MSDQRKAKSKWLKDGVGLPAADRPQLNSSLAPHPQAQDPGIFVFRIIDLFDKFG
jgi:hypothetical protein